MSDVGTFTCRYCDSPEALTWPPNWKKGMKPVKALNGEPHICEKKDSGKSYKCRGCGNLIMVFNQEFDPNQLCSECEYNA